MNAIIPLLISLCVFSLAYRYYAAFIAAKVLVLDNKKIIEFNGDIWHANPNLYDNNNKPFCYENIDLNEIWDFEKKKLRIAKNRGFEILVIWENEYRDSKDEVINKCLKFLNNE